MSNKQPTKFLDTDGDGVVDNPKLLLGRSKTLVQAWKCERYLQIAGDNTYVKKTGEEISESDISDEDLDIKAENENDSHLRIACGDF